jgi:hypothetical protein
LDEENLQVFDCLIVVCIQCSNHEAIQQYSNSTII